MFKKIVITIPKVLWFILCYLIALMLAIVSGYFTFRFYTDTASEYDFYFLGVMAISLELIKIFFSAGYPFMKGKSKSIESTVLLIIRVSFLLSILASIYYLLLSKDITLSPAAKTISMLYEYMPFLYIVPLKFAQFLGTISLTVLIEFFIVFLPVTAPIMFYKANYEDRKQYAANNIQKLKEIFVSIPNNLIDKLYKKVVNVEMIERPLITDSEKVTNIDNYRDKKINIENPVIEKGTEIKDDKKAISENQETITPLFDRDTEKQINENSTLDKIKPETPFNDRDIKELLDAIFKYKEGFICPSVKVLAEKTSLSRPKINKIKKYLDDLGIINTTGTTTSLNIDDIEQAFKAIELGGVGYEME